MGREGVTLLEILIVVIIVAILAGVAMPNYARTVEKAKVQEAEGILTTIYQAQRIYRLDYDTFTTLALLDSNRYLTSPTSSNWSFTDSTAPTAATFQVKASRTGGAQYLRVDQTGQICKSAGYDTSVSNRPVCP